MPKKPQLDVHPSVVFQLGEDLITDELQALVELIKNAYDAGATFAKVTIDTTSRVVEEFDETFYPGAIGFVSITDNGAGMDYDQLSDGWLVISNSAKRELKSSEKRWKKGERVPLGDKGLGRLGAQRLGHFVEVFTRTKKDETTHHVGLAWKAFEGQQRLSQVPIEYGVAKQRKTSGTCILIGGLRNASRWRDRGELASKLAELISPFGSVDKLRLLITIDGTPLDMAQVTASMRQEADSTFSFEFDGETLRVNGSVKFRTLEPRGKERRRAFDKYCVEDDGDVLFKYLTSKQKDAGLALRRLRSGGWYASFSQTIEFAMLDGLADEEPAQLAEHSDVDQPNGTEDDLDEGVGDEHSKPPPQPTAANPGSFRGELDAYSLSPRRAKQQEAFSVAKEYRDYVKNLAGVRVYRDGFGVRVGDDFLELGQQWSSADSWYTLKPVNTIGFLALSARDNAALIETTDREGFKDTPAFRNLRELLRAFVRETARFLEYLRRNTLDFCAERAQEEAGVDSAMTAEDTADKIGKELAAAAESRDVVENVQQQLSTIGISVTEAAKAVRTLPDDTQQALDGIVSELHQRLDSVKSSLDSAATALGHVETLRSRFAVVQSHIDKFNERLDQSYELMSVGLTAEALAHEMRIIAEGLEGRTKAAVRYLKKSKFDDEYLEGYTNQIRSSIAALRKQLSRLDPSLRYVRERRERFSLDVFLEKLVEYHHSRWRDLSLSITVSRLKKGPFDVHVNRGKLTQVFDNLVLNSEHWLKEDLRLGRIVNGEISIELQTPYVWLSDNGRGIDPRVEGALFEPFVTTRKKGRGLGLFLVREFLEGESCAVSLYHERNAADRLYAFELDLSGIAAGEE